MGRYSLVAGHDDEGVASSVKLQYFWSVPSHVDSAWTRRRLSGKRPDTRFDFSIQQVPSATPSHSHSSGCVSSLSLCIIERPNPFRHAAWP